MDLTITSLGNLEFLSAILSGVASICGTGDWARLVSIGFLVGLFFLGFQCLATGARRVNLHHTMLCFICYLILFGPTGTVTVEDAYTGETQEVQDLPLGVGIAGSAISSIGYTVTRLMEEGYAETDRMSTKPFAEDLRVVQRLRDVVASDAVFDAINTKMGDAAGGTPTDSKRALTEYLANCTMIKMQVGLTTPSAVYQAGWGDEFKFNSNINLVELPIPDAGGGNNRMYYCSQAQNAVNTIFDQLGEVDVIRAINREMHIDNDAGDDVAEDFTVITDALNNLGAAMGGANDVIRMMMIDSVYDSAAQLFYQKMQHPEAASAVKAASDARAASQNNGLALGAVNLSRGLMAFFEGFVYAVTPILGFLIATGSFGIHLIGKYFKTIVWIQLWVPILSILNLYVMTNTRFLMGRAELGDAATMYAIDMLNSEAQSWLLTGGLLTAATPFIALFLVAGSSVAVSAIADHFGSSDSGTRETGAYNTPSITVLNPSPVTAPDRSVDVNLSGTQTVKADVNISGGTRSSVEVTHIGSAQPTYVEEDRHVTVGSTAQRY